MQIRVLGPVEVVGVDGAARWERKARELLVLLALRAPAAVGLDELVELLWDDPPPSAARSTQAHVSRLRAGLAVAAPGVEVVRAGAGAYALRAPAAATDVDEVAALRSEARARAGTGDHDGAAALLQRARTLWRGEPELPPTVTARAVAERWAHERRDLAAAHLAAVVDGSHPGDAVAELHAATADDPHDEPRWALLVLALHRSGRRTAALRAFQAARAALAEVGLDPGPGLRSAEAAVLDEPAAVPEPAPAEPAPTEPAPASPSAALRVRYAAAGPVNVAYTIVGDGPRDLLLLNPGLVSIDGLADEERLAAAVARLAAHRRVVGLDRRGIGLSDPAPTGVPTLEDWVDDVVAVLDASGATTPLVLASSDTCLVALALAAAHPERVGALVLVHGYARYLRAPDHPWGVDPYTAVQQSAEVVATDAPPGGFDPLAHIAPSVAGDPAFRAWWDAMGRRAASPTTAASLHDVIMSGDVRSRLARVAVPVLLLHRRSCASCDIGHARHLAEHLPDARLVVLPGADELWFTGDAAALLDEVERFAAAVGA